MKLSILIYFCISSFQFAFGQYRDGEKPSPYLLSEFQEGTLYYRSTPPQQAELNYHKISEEMVMKLRKLMVPINDIEALDSIQLGSSTFVRIESRFYEQLSNKGKQLLVQHRSTTQEATKTGAYGSVAHTGGVEVLGSVEKQIEFYALHWEDHKSIIDRTEYFIKDGTTWHKVKNYKHLANLFPTKKKQLKVFMNQNKLRLDRPLDLKKAFEFCVE